MSKIEWTDKTWNPVTGCTKVSQGCKNCYAERMYERFNGKGSFKNITCHPERLNHPMRWKKPCMVFVNSMSDLFHEDVPFEFIDKVFVIMKLASRHTFQVLTKRTNRMLEYFSEGRPQILDDTVLNMMEADELDGIGSAVCFQQADGLLNWPLPNVWIGVSVENQQAADERIPALMKVPAAIHFLSCEPLLGFVNIAKFMIHQWESLEAAPKHITAIDWLICGGESGHGSRPMHPDWARFLRDQCESAGIAFFFKQWGEYGPHPGIFHHKHPYTFDDGTVVYKCNKRQNGKMLDEIYYEQIPEIKTPNRCTYQ